jgi:hypothetical protein
MTEVQGVPQRLVRPPRPPKFQLHKRRKRESNSSRLLVAFLILFLKTEKSSQPDSQAVGKTVKYVSFTNPFTRDLYEYPFREVIEKSITNIILAARYATKLRRYNLLYHQTT